MHCASVAAALLVLWASATSLSADDTRHISDRVKSIEVLQSRNVAALAARKTVDPLASQFLKCELSALCEIDPSEFVPSELVKFAECCLKARQFDDSLRYASAAIVRDPTDDAANSLVVQSFVYLKRFDDAADALETAKQHVSPKARARGLHSLIYFQLAARKEWNRSVPHIEEHIQHLSVVATTYSEAPVQLHFWVDQLALAYKHAIADDSDRQRKLDEHWQTLSALSPIAIVPWKEASLRRRCAVLELQCAIEVHVEQQRFDVRLSRWINTILESELHRREGDFASETLAICQFIRTHGQKLDFPDRMNLAERLKQMESACFRTCPSKGMQQLHATLTQTRESLNSSHAIKPVESR